MTKMLICYHSESGTTESMAEEIFKGAENSGAEIEVEIKKVEETDVETLPEYDCLILGSPTYYGLPSGEMKTFIDESITHHADLDGMLGGAFSSSANPAGGNETTVMALLEALIIHGMIVKGMPKGDHYGPVVVKEPDERELKQCRHYGEMMAELAEKISEV